MWPVRALESQMARARVGYALEGLAEMIVLLWKGALQRTHRQSHSLMCLIEGEDVCDDLLDCLVSKIGKCKSHP